MTKLFQKKTLLLLFTSALLVLSPGRIFSQIGNYNPLVGSISVAPGNTGSATIGCFVPLPTTNNGSFYFTYTSTGSSIASNVTVSATTSGMTYTTYNAGSANPFYFNGNGIKVNVTLSASAQYCNAQTFSINMYKYNGNGYYYWCTYTLTVTCEDDSKNNMVVIGSGTYYVTDDARIDRQYWDPNLGWQYEAITPVGGWGAVRVAGWLAAEYNNDQVFFKGTDKNLYNIYKSAGNWYLGKLSYWNLNTHTADVLGCIKVRQDGVFYIGADLHIHHFYWTTAHMAWSYEAINPLYYGWTVSAGGYNLLSGNLIDGAMELAPAPATNIYFRGSDNKIYNLFGSLTQWNLGLISPTGAADCGGDMVADNGGLYYRGTDNFVHKLYWGGSGWTYDAMTPSNLATGNSKGHLSKFPGEDRVFYKGNDNLLYNIYKNGSQWDVFPLSYSVNTVAGDIIAADWKIFFIATDKRPHNFWWGGSGWNDNALTYSIANARNCSLNYRAFEAEAETAQPEAFVPVKSFSKIFPNPGNGILQLDYLHGRVSSASVTVYNSLGELVKEEEFTNANPEGPESFRFDAGSLAKGIYMVIIRSGSEWRETHRLVIN